jgi:hypothetical protein
VKSASWDFVVGEHLAQELAKNACPPFEVQLAIGRGRGNYEIAALFRLLKNCSFHNCSQRSFEHQRLPPVAPPDAFYDVHGLGPASKARIAGYGWAGSKFAGSLHRITLVPARAG